MSAPLILWLAGYLVTMRYFIPRLGRISHAQSDARSIMTGRIVDTYTNISTVKMFAHADREDGYALRSMNALPRHGAPAAAPGDAADGGAQLPQRAAAVLGGRLVAVAVVDRCGDAPARIALTVGLVLRLQGMSHWIMWEVAGLFENIGVVQDGLETIARERSVVDAPDAKPLVVPKGEIQLRAHPLQLRTRRNSGARQRHRGSLLHVAPGEKVGLVGRSGAGKSTLVSLLMRFYDLDGGRVLIDGQDIAHVTQDSLRAQIGMVTQDTSLLHRSVLDNILYGTARDGLPTPARRMPPPRRRRPRRTISSATSRT